jgi:hypothetical protein
MSVCVLLYLGNGLWPARGEVSIQAVPRLLEARYGHLSRSGRNHHGMFNRQSCQCSTDYQVSSEWWAWEACALAASMLGPVSLAAQSCLLSTTSTFFQVPASLGIAASVRTGNLLGAGRGWEAKWASRTSLIMSIFFSACNRSVFCISEVLPANP